MKDRLKIILEKRTPSRGRFNELSQVSKVPVDTWKSFWYGRQRPTVEMIETVAKLWPEYAFWLITGLTDQTHGHISTEEHTYPEQLVHPRECAAKFFKKAIYVSERHKNKKRERIKDILELEYLQKKRTLEEESLNKLEKTSEASKVVSLLEQSQSTTDKKSSKIIDLLEKLQHRKELNDSQTAALLGISLDDLEEIKHGQVQLSARSTIRLLDSYGYVFVRNLLLTLFPENIVTKVQNFDIERDQKRLTEKE